MELTKQEEAMLDGEYGKSTQKAMQILTTLGDIYGAERMTKVVSVQIAGVSYSNLDEAGLEFLHEMSEDGQTRVLTTLNPAGIDIQNWKKLGIDEEFAKNQKRVLDAFGKMGVIQTATCTPYLVGNLPHMGQHIAWAESSAVAFANSVIGARTNREGGPSAIASSLTGRTPYYGLHLDENRHADIRVDVKTEIHGDHGFGILGRAIGDKLEELELKKPYITGIKEATMEELKSFGASIATFAGTPLYHMEDITPEYNKYPVPKDSFEITVQDYNRAKDKLTDQDVEIDFVSIGCPHASLDEIATVAKLLKDKKVTKEFWITTARPTKRLADAAGYTKVIEDAGAKFAADTCCVVAPIKGMFNAIMVNSAKACYYGRAKNNFKVKIGSIKECVQEAIQ